MKKLFSSALAILLLSGLSSYAQDCKMYFPDKVGTVREITSYDKKGKVTGSSNQEITDRQVSGSSIAVKVRSEVFDKDKKSLSVNEMTYSCNNGVFSFNMQDFIDKSMLEPYKDMEVTMKGDNLAYPANLKVGDKLDNASINIVVKNQGVVMMNWTITVSNRVVAAKESVTTSAGTFDTYKLTYDLQTKTRIMTINSKAAEWISDGVGMIKSESYDKNGKLLSSSALTKLRK